MISQPEIRTVTFDELVQYELRVLIAGKRTVAQVFDTLAEATRVYRFLGLVQEAIEIEEGE